MTRVSAIAAATATACLAACGGHASPTTQRPLPSTRVAVATAFVTAMKGPRWARGAELAAQESQNPMLDSLKDIHRMIVDWQLRQIGSIRVHGDNAVVSFKGLVHGTRIDRKSTLEVSMTLVLRDGAWRVYDTQTESNTATGPTGTFGP